MKKILVVIVLLTAGACMAQQTDSYNSWFEEGNAAYNDGDYQQALTMYENIVSAGMESAALYYNMGNTYYKMKEYPNAILYYEKALKLDPGNEDIQTNLEIANLTVVDKINTIPQSFISRKWNGLKSSFSVDGWAWISVAAFAMLLLCLFAFFMARRTGLRKTGFFAGLFMLACLALSLVFAVSKQREMNRQDEAIVMTPTVTVKSSPSEKSVDLFVLHEGTKVRVLDSASDWCKIRITDGSVGWMQAKDMTAF